MYSAPRLIGRIQRIVVVAALVFIAAGCAIEGPGTNQTGIGLLIGFGHHGVSPLSTTPGTMAVFIVDESSLSPQASVVARIEARLNGTEPPGTSGAPTSTHRELSFVYAPGTAGDATIDGLRGNVRYLVLVVAEYLDGNSELVRRTGFTRVTAIPGATVTASITVGDRFNEIATRFEEWYGITIEYAETVAVQPPVFASGPGISAEPGLPEPTGETNPVFSWAGGGNGTGVFEYSTDGGTTWNETTATTVQIGPLTPGEYSFRVRERGASGDWSDPAVAYFSVIEGSFATITITNPDAPEFTFSAEGFTLDRSISQSIEISVSTAVTIESYLWLINGVQLGNAPTFTVQSGAPELNLGVNGLTLMIEVAGVPYSEDFLFTVVEN